jgi:cysteine desulfurase
VIYFDANAGVPATAAALAAYESAAEVIGNPSSAHELGRRAREVLEEARRSVAAFLGAEPDEIVFTSGGTESDALALTGVLRGSRAHVVTTSIEHPAVSRTLVALPLELTVVPAGRSGRVESERFRAALRDDTRLVSVIAASNETGVVQPIDEIGRAARSRGALFHTDAVQAIGRVPVDLAHVDLLSLSGHKLGAVGGIGALYVRRGVRLEPLLVGGGQEAGRRATTENVAGAASLAAARAELPNEAERARLASLRDRLEREIAARAGDVESLGMSAPRLPNTTCLRFAGCEGDAIMMALDLCGIAVSTGSACSSGSIEPSPVLLGMGLMPAEAKSAVRYSLPRSATAAEVDRAVDATVDVVQRIRG